MRERALAFSRWVDGGMFWITPTLLVLGLLISKPLLPFVPAIPYLFAYITFVMGVGCGRGHLKQVFSRPLPIVLTLVLCHVIAPLAAFGLGSAAFGASSPYTIGLVLFTVIPLGVSSVLWIELAGGSMALGLAMVLLDSALSPIVVPGLIQLFFGAELTFDTVHMMRDLLLMVVAPTAIGVIVYERSGGRFKEKAAPVLLPVSKIFFMLVILLNAAGIAPYAYELRGDLGAVIPAVLLLVAIGYLLGYYSPYLLKKRTPDLPITVSFAAGMRNNSLGLVLALGYFSPQTAVPVVLAILIQQPLATLHQFILQRVGPYRMKERLPR
ncbi:bile acid:sodium symporter family protein [Saccharibacillus sp. CPCC 101409]|uniref:bile acid:sodium symporter family protein n=1 Tax=Saccharibacillus sp. CPCC 101409 TaxID=3058041 RepID=UPI002671D969|nr:bile acid:sodium symporter family protein [Saccharibacillus sp. CPCC 101409]MDO3408864.1 bile acid:sodium symporter family protein [Saccharibacillus sp. CPCC 101409]